MKMLATVKVMSIPTVAQIMEGKMYAQYNALCGMIAKSNGATIQEMPEMMMRIVPGSRWRTKPPKVAMIHPPRAIGTNQATTCNGEAPMTFSI